MTFTESERKQRQADYNASDKGKARQGTWNASAKGKAANLLNSKAMRLKYPEKRRAHDAVYRATKRGDLVRPNVCEHCDASVFTEASHTDYSKQLDVEWLCKSCHWVKDNTTKKENITDENIDYRPTDGSVQRSHRTG